MKTVSVQDIPRVANDCVILDVRTPAEHAEAHLQRAHDHVPLDMLDPRDFMMRRGLDRDTAIYILCRSGGRATTAAEKFTSEGYGNVFVVEGGITSCEAQGEPVVKNSAANDAGAAAAEKAKTALNQTYAKLAKFPLNRQVEMMVGGVVAFFSLLALGGAEGFALVTLLAGGALVYKGLTGWCAGEKLLMKAPWNKNKSCGADKTGGGTCA